MSLIVDGVTIYDGGNVFMQDGTKPKKIVYDGNVVWQDLMVINLAGGLNTNLASIIASKGLSPGTAVKFVLPLGIVLGSKTSAPSFATGDLSKYKVTLELDGGGMIQAGTGVAMSITSPITIINNGAILGHGGNGGHGGKGANKSHSVTRHYSGLSFVRNEIAHGSHIPPGWSLVYNKWRQRVLRGPCGATIGAVTGSHVICGVNIKVGIRGISGYTGLSFPSGVTTTTTILGGAGGAIGVGQRYGVASSGPHGGHGSSPAGGNSGGAGGAGGRWGKPGGNGVGGAGRTNGTAAGIAVQGTKLVTWIKQGDVRGGIA